MRGSAPCLVFSFTKESLLRGETSYLWSQYINNHKKPCVCPLIVLQSNRMQRGTVFAINVRDCNYLS